MSKLDDLINELCPDGVEYQKLENCCEILDTQRKPISKAAREAGNYPYYGANGIQDYVSNYIFDGTFVLIGEDGSVLTPNGNPVVNWATGKIWVNNHAHILSEKKNVSLRYLFHYVQIINIKELVHGNIPKLTQGDLRNLEIPVPPLEIQNEIVRILDNFTELEEELEEELEARRKQYEYYRDLLLTFDDTVEWKTIKELFNTKNGYTPSTSNSSFWDNGTIPWFVMDDIRTNGRILSESKQHITPAAVKGSGLFKKNSIIVATSATIGEHALITTDFLSNQRFTCLYPKEEFESKIDMKFIFYYSFLLDDFCKNNTTVSSFASVDMKKFYDFKFPIPSLDEQKRIVSILDRFDELTTNITSGLPAEIEARHKQYEYYRDKLLTFKRKDEK